jgi:hypothetical protein
MPFQSMVYYVQNIQQTHSWVFGWFDRNSSPS